MRSKSPVGNPQHPHRRPAKAKPQSTTRKPQTKGWHEGSVYLRSDGRWVAAVSYTDPSTGKRRRKSVYAASEREAKERLINTQAELLKGQPPRPGVQTVTSFLHDWLESRTYEVRPSTKKREGEYINLHIIPTIGSRRLVQLSARDLDQLYLASHRKGLSQQTVHHIHSVIHRALEAAVRSDLIANNPASRVRAPRVDHTPAAFLTRTEASRFMDLLHNARNDAIINQQQAAIFALALSTGARQGELLALRGEDVDWEAHTITITRSVQLRKEIGNTKTAGSKRSVEFSDEASRFLPRPPKPEMLLFPSPTDPRIPVSPATLWDAFHRYMLYAQITKDDPHGNPVPKITFHGLRHTAATLMLQGIPDPPLGEAPIAGLSPHVVASILGHSSTALLWRTYAHVIPPAKGTQSRLMDAHLSHFDNTLSSPERRPRRPKQSVQPPVERRKANS